MQDFGQQKERNGHAKGLHEEIYKSQLRQVRSADLQDPRCASAYFVLWFLNILAAN